jgi:hypothetical protein
MPATRTQLSPADPIAARIDGGGGLRLGCDAVEPASDVD